jgi:hypothetical protein
MNRLPDSTCQLNEVDSMPRTLARAARSKAAHAIYASNWWTIVTVALIVWISCGLVEVRVAAAQEVPEVPSGIIEFSGGSVAVGIGYTWGKGILIFEGKHYPLKVDGLSIVHVGVSSYTASGTVYHLTNPSDINGVYTAVSAGAAVAGGASATAMKNSKGVVIEMASTHVGLNFSLSAKGVTIAMYGTPF